MSKLKIGDAPKIKHALGLSSKSILHNWDTVTAKGTVPQLGKHINRVANLAKGANTFGWLGIGVDAAVSATNITHACMGEDTSQCERVSYKEGGGLGGSILGGMAGGAAGTKVGTIIGSGLVILLGIGTGGIGIVAIAAVAGAGIGGYFGGGAGKDFGQERGIKLYELIKEDSK